MPDAEAAYVIAQSRIEDALKSGADHLPLSIQNLAEIPSEIAGLTGLLSLDLDGTQVSDLTPLQDLTALQTLNLDNTQVSDLTPLQDLTALQTLLLNRTQVSDLTPLQGLTDLQELYLDHTQVSDLTPLQGLTALKRLDLDSTQVTDLRPIRDAAFDDSEPFIGLRFGQTPAARATPEMTRLSEIEDAKTRTRDTLAYLKTLPPLNRPLKITASDQSKKLRESLSQGREEMKGIERAIDYTRRELAAVQTALDARKNDADLIERQLKTFQDALSSAQDSLETIQTTANSSLENLIATFDQRMDAAASAFREDQAVAAPVALWTEKQAEHEKSRDRAFRWFVAGLGIVVVSVSGLLYFMVDRPELFETLLSPVGCQPENPESCRGIGLRGVLATASALTVFTVLLWFTRLQMKLFLAERHLVLDSRERRAFAQTYVGLLNEAATTDEAQEQRAMVYASLFRPASDGTVKDDGGMDPAITAAISKILAGK